MKNKLCNANEQIIISSQASRQYVELVTSQLDGVEMKFESILGWEDDGVASMAMPISRYLLFVNEQRI